MKWNELPFEVVIFLLVALLQKGGVNIVGIAVDFFIK